MLGVVVGGGLGAGVHGGEPGGWVGILVVDDVRAPRAPLRTAGQCSGQCSGQEAAAAATFTRNGAACSSMPS